MAAITTRAKDCNIDFEASFLKDDSYRGVKKFRRWRVNHPTYELKAGNGKGQTITMAALVHGNVHLIRHIINLTDATYLNMLDHKGFTIFEQIFKNPQENGDIEKVIECVKILIDAGTDINKCNETEYDKSSPLGTATHYVAMRFLTHDREVVEQRLKYCYPFIDLCVQMGARCIYPHGGHNDQHEVLEEARKRIWDERSLIWLAYKSPQSPLHSVPEELVKKIMTLNLC